MSILFGDTLQSLVAGGLSALEAVQDILLRILLLCGITFVLSATWHSSLSLVSARVETRLGAMYLQALLEKDVQWFDLNEVSELPGRMVVDVQNIKRSSGTVSGSLAAHMAQLVAGLGVAFYRSWELTLVLLAAAPFFGVTGSLVARASMRSMNSNAQLYVSAGAVAEQALLAIRTVVAFGGEEREAERYRQRLAPSLAGGVRAGAFLGLARGLFTQMLHLFFAVAYLYSAWKLIGTGRVSLATGQPFTGGDVLTVLFAMHMGLSVFSNAPEDVQKFLPGLGSLETLQRLIEEPGEIEGRAACDEAFVVPALSLDMQRLETLTEGAIKEIAFQDVDFSYPSRRELPILSGFSLTIRRRQKVALVGESGSGKSTVIQLLLRFYDADGGQVLVNRSPIGSFALRAFRRQMGYVGQEPVLFGTSVRANIQGGDRTMSDVQVMEAVSQAQLAPLVKSLPHGLGTFVGSQGCQFSGGQKQRIAIARAMARKPQILLLDEATSALDNESERLVQETIDELQRSSRSLTTISIAHRLSTVRNADVIFFLRHGSVIEEGTHDELVARRGAYFDAVESQGQPAADGSVAAGAQSPVEAAAPDALVLPGQVPISEASLAVPRAMHSFTSAGTDTSSKGMPILEGPSVAPAFRRLLGMTSPAEKRVLCALMLLIVASSAAMPVLGYMLGASTGSFYVAPASAMRAEVLEWCLLLLASGFAQIVIFPFRGALLHYVIESLMLRLRALAFRSILRQPVGFFDDPRNNVAGICASLESEAQIAGNVVLSLSSILGCFCSIAWALAIGCAACWQLTLSLAVIIPGFVGVNGLMLRASASQASEASRGTEIASEAVLNMRTVHALVAETHLQELHWAAQGGATRVQGVLVGGVVFAVGNLNTLLIFLSGFLVGALLIDHAGVEADGVLRALMTVATGSAGAAHQISHAQDVQSERSAVDSIFAKIDLPSDPPCEHQPAWSLEQGASIEFREVRFEYPHRPKLPVLRGLSFSVQVGQSVALVGPSGSGKSTIMQLLLRFYSPSAGAILIGGVPLGSMSSAWWRMQVGLVGQEPVLFDTTLEENVRYGKPSATAKELEAAARDANMDYVLSGKVRWSDRVGSRGSQLSGGQKQRCAIARALVRSPKVLLLDEATSALDSAAEREVQAALATARRGRTTFSIAHRLSTVKDSDLVLVVEAGRVAEQGSHDELMELRGLYWNLSRR